MLFVSIIWLIVEAYGYLSPDEVQNNELKFIVKPYNKPDKNNSCDPSIKNTPSPIEAPEDTTNDAPGTMNWIITDYGPMQVNYQTWEAYEAPKKRMT